MYQGLDANPTWVAGLLDAHARHRHRHDRRHRVDGLRQPRLGDDVGNAHYGLTTEAGGSTFVLLGTATPEEFLTLATALVPDHRRAAAERTPP